MVDNLHYSSIHSKIPFACRSGFAQKSFNVSLERQIAEMRLHGNYIPLERRVPTPTDIFTKIVHEFHDKKKPGNQSLQSINLSIINMFTNHAA